MRNNQIPSGFAITFVGAMCLSIGAAAQQTKSTSLRQLVPQIATDAIGFDSGLWRSEFLNQRNPEDNDAEEPGSDGTKPATPPVPAKSPEPAFVYSNKLITIPLDTSAVAETHVPDAKDESSLQAETTLSEWENAVAESGASVTPGSTASGPSVISAIVGFVGIMIVIGAYASSGNRNR